MKIYSGQCEEGTCGTPTNLVDSWGNELFVGDIVSMSTNERVMWSFHGLSAVVEDRPNLVGRTDSPIPHFIMGLYSIDWTNPEQWLIHKVKDWKDCVDGEHWKEYGFHYKK